MSNNLSSQSSKKLYVQVWVTTGSSNLLVTEKDREKEIYFFTVTPVITGVAKASILTIEFLLFSGKMSCLIAHQTFLGFHIALRCSMRKMARAIFFARDGKYGNTSRNGIIK